MDIPVPLENFQNRNLTLRTAGLLMGPRLFMDQALLRPSKGRYILKDNLGKEVELKIKFNLIDPVPKIEVDGETVELAPRLKKYEYAWAGFSVFLVFLGGILGALCAFWAIYFNFRIFRSRRLPLPAKYIVSGLITAIALIVYYLLGQKASILLRQSNRKAPGL